MTSGSSEVGVIRVVGKGFWLLKVGKVQGGGDQETGRKGLRNGKY